MIKRSEDADGNPSGELTTVIGTEGDKNGATIPLTNGYENDMLMVGQIHTHDLAPSGETNVVGTSSTDNEASNEQNFNVYSI